MTQFLEGPTSPPPHPPTLIRGGSNYDVLPRFVVYVLEVGVRQSAAGITALQWLHLMSSFK